MRPSLFALLVSLVAACLASPSRAADAPSAAQGFSIQNVPGDHLDVLLDGKVAARYMYAHDTSTKDRRAETYKPYLHVFDAEGKEPITKGPGGEYTHHRGIFIGWNKITFDGKPYDRWHMVGKYPGEIVHQEFTQQQAGPDAATITSLTHWNDEAGKPFLIEERTMAFRRGPAPFRLLIDFSSKLTAPTGDVNLDGDPEHAGVHYRPSDDVDRTKTIYTYPAEHPQPHKDLDYPWVGETYTLKTPGKTYSVVEMAHPTDPKETHWSAYRNYGRFGAFFKHEVKKGEALSVKYRFLVGDGPMPAADVIDKSYAEFAGVPAPAGPVTTLAAEGSAPSKPKESKPAKAPATK